MIDELKSIDIIKLIVEEYFLHGSIYNAYTTYILG